MLPTLFIGHGSPMNALGGNEYSQSLARLANTIERPRGILVVSAHWETRGTEVLDLALPATIHDFSGFPKELYQIRYPAPGATALAERVGELLGKQVTRSGAWGFDHGTWSVLRHLYPAADIPVTQLSLSRTLTLRQHYDVAALLKPLRHEGILILGSGNVVHNLGEFSWNENETPFQWAVDFDAWIGEAIDNRDLNRLLEFKGMKPELFQRAVPSFEHYLPLIYALAASETNESISYPFLAMQNGSISMRSVRFG